MGNQPGTDIQVVTHAFAAMEKQFESLLPANVPSKRFMRTALMAIEGNPKLLQCDRNSLYNACKMAAQDGLVIDGREAAIVPFKGEAKYMPMVTGIIKRARNSGDVDTVTPAIVHELDTFDIDYGERKPLTFKPAKGDRGEPIGAVCIVWNKSGSMEFEYMTANDIHAVRQCSKQKESLQWTTFWTEGWKKTVIRRLFKRLPMSSEIDRVFGHVDSEYDFSDKSPEQAGEPAEQTPQRTRAEQAVADQMGDVHEGEFEPVDADDDSII